MKDTTVEVKIEPYTLHVPSLGQPELEEVYKIARQHATEQVTKYVAERITDKVVEELREEIEAVATRVAHNMIS